MHIFTKDGIMKSHYIHEDYFPVTIMFEPFANSCRHVVLQKEDTDSIELSLDTKSGELRKILLILCSHFSETSEKIEPPEASEGILFFDLPKVTECSDFKMDIHPDGLTFTFNNEPIARFIKGGQVYFGVNESESIAKIIITDLSEKDITHVKNELSI